MNEDLPETETVLLGVREGDEDWQEVLLSTIPKNFDLIRDRAVKHGWGRFRVATINLGSPPNFVRALNMARGR